jgi:hypothetical protein
MGMGIPDGGGWRVEREAVGRGLDVVDFGLEHAVVDALD